MNPLLNVIKKEAVSPELIQVTCRLTHRDGTHNNEPALMEAIASSFDGKCRGVEGSFISLASTVQGMKEVVKGFVVPNTEVKPYVQGMKGMRSMSGNMFMDEEDQVWALRRSESGDLLVKKNIGIDSISLDDLIAEASVLETHNHEFTAMQDHINMQNSVVGGDVVTYTTEDGVQCGMVVASSTDENDVESLEILPFGKDEHESVSRSQVNMRGVVSDEEIHDVDTVFESESGTADVNKLVEYYRKIYGHNARFFSEFEARIRGHRFGA